MNKFLIIPALVLISACTTTKIDRPEPQIVTVEVPVPTPAPCVPKNLGLAPDYVDEDLALINAKDAAERYQLLYAGRLQRKSRLGELEPIVIACPREK